MPIVVGSLAIFGLSAAFVAFAGVHLAKAADELAERLGIPRLIIGILLVASATSSGLRCLQ